MDSMLEGYLENMEDFPCEFGDVVNDNFWEIIASVEEDTDEDTAGSSSG